MIARVLRGKDRIIYAIEITADKDLIWKSSPDIVPNEREVLIQVRAAGVNRADILQTAGYYPPPPGASKILGLEISGIITQCGSKVSGWSVGMPVCALLTGGGYAEYVAVPQEQLLPIPHGVSMIDAAGLPEIACTVWSNLVQVGHLHANQLLLIHGGAGGVGTHAIQIAHYLGARVAVTAGSEEKLQLCRDLGAEITINYHDDDFVSCMNQYGGADMILDVMGAAYLERNIDALAPDGTLLIIGLQGGTKNPINLAKLVSKRLHVVGTTLRSRPIDGKHGKARIVKEVTTQVWPLIEQGHITPLVGAYFPIEHAQQAHQVLLSGTVSGKIILTFPH